MKKDRKKEAKISTGELQAAILKLFRANPTKNYSASHIIEKLKIGNNKDSIKYALDQLETSGQLKTVAKPKNTNTATLPLDWDKELLEYYSLTFFHFD